jgi:ABC-type uncharacterized transport system YnjBCD permease subunit
VTSALMCSSTPPSLTHAAWQWLLITDSSSLHAASLAAIVWCHVPVPPDCAYTAKAL